MTCDVFTQNEYPQLNWIRFPTPTTIPQGFHPPTFSRRQRAIHQFVSKLLQQIESHDRTVSGLALEVCIVYAVT